MILFYAKWRKYSSCLRSQLSRTAAAVLYSALYLFYYNLLISLGFTFVGIEQSYIMATNEKIVQIPMTV